MKRRLLLSALTCVLALGLVSACNDEEEDLSGGDSGTQTDGGGSGSGDTSGTGGGSSDTGSGGGTTEAVTLTNYTVSFSFVDEDGVATTLGDGYTLYLQGSWSTDESGTWLGWIECEFDEVTGYYVATFESIDAGSYEYKGVSVPDGEDPAYGYIDEETKDWVSWEVITGTYGTNGTNALLTIDASSGDNDTHIITVSITGGVIEEPFDPEDYAFTYKISIEHESTPLEAAPAGVVLYAAGTFNISSGDTWADPIRLYDNGDGTYYLGLDFVPTSGTSLNIYADDTSDSTHDMWGYMVGTHTVAAEDLTSTDDHPVVEITISTEYVGWAVEGGVFPPLGEDVEFYVLIYDNSPTSGTTGLSGSDSATFSAQVACWSNGTSDSCTATEVATTNSSTYAFYSEVATAPEHTNTWFSFVIGNATMSIAASNVPSSESGTPVYVNYGWMDSSWLNGQSWNANDSAEGTWSYLTDGQTIEQFAQAITLS